MTERIAVIERSREDVYRIKQIFGFGARELTKSEKEIFTRWTQSYGYELDVIRMAYDITVDAIQKPVPKYADKIIEKWHCEGLRTVEDIEKYESAKREGAKAQSENDPQKSYEVDDFFEAALKRSFEDLK